MIQPRSISGNSVPSRGQAFHETGVLGACGWKRCSYNVRKSLSASRGRGKAGQWQNVRKNK